MAPSPPADVSIEAAESDDASAFADLWVDLAADQRQHGSHLRPSANRGRIREAMLQHVVTDTVLLAERDGDIVGFVTFGRESESFEQDVTRGLVHNIYVTAGHRGEGIGSALLAAAEETLAERGVDSVALQAMAANDEAREFYRRHGYDPHRIELEKAVESDSLTTDDG
ncbi:MAG: ribosomal protein S18 acetylase RimI-like enzyme [Natronomonas sp.]|jgi:ribosomal protein S18 acetylase RimI-like enzyme|uniref:GNAT family N-acetyltransferase n=1 Tax=Natronomonas sp. TaxID=2184060 RepID=UPI003989FFF9